MKKVLLAFLFVFLLTSVAFAEGIASRKLFDESGNTVTLKNTRDLEVDGDLSLNGELLIAEDISDYAYLTMSGDQTSHAANSNIDFDLMAEGNMTFDTVNSRLTLRAGRTYYLDARHRALGSATNCQLITRWYNVTDSEWIGVYGQSLGVAYSTNYSSTPFPTGVVTPATDILVEVRIVTSTNITNITAIYARAIVMEII